MGVDLYCNDYRFSCSYGGWHEYRKNIILSTMDYIQNLIDNRPSDSDREENNDSDRE